MLDVEPVVVGPTWRRLPDGSFDLPERTLAWQIIPWCWEYLKQPDGPQADEPWQFTNEQARFLAWWYAVDERGRFAYRRGVLRRMKGWGKDPLGAVICAVEFVGPCRFDGWDASGEPVAVPHLASFVSTAAVSKEQTQNTMTLFPGLFTDDCIREHSIDLGKEIIYADRGRRRIKAVTSSPRALEGNRASFTLMNETQHWISSNEGHEMAKVIRRNLGKSRDGSARALAITNAHQPGEDSVGEQDWDGHLAVQEGRYRESGVLYDSIEAPFDTKMEDRERLAAGLRAARGDSVWLDVERLIDEIYDYNTTRSESRRFYLNQVVAAEDAYFDPLQVKAAMVDAPPFADGERVVMFGDGSKSDDATGLVLVRVSDGVACVHHVQQPKAGEIVNREAVDYAVRDAMDRFRVKAFWFDPSHTKDSDAEGDSRFWWPLVDDWSQRYGKKLSFHPTKSGLKRHAVAFDMSTRLSQSMIVPAYEQLASDIENGEFKFLRSDWLLNHLVNAKRRPGGFGISMGKDNRESKKKIDLAVCAAGARMLWRLVKLNDRTGTPGRGRVIVMAD